MKNLSRITFRGGGPLPGPQGVRKDMYRKHIFGGGGTLPGREVAESIYWVGFGAVMANKTNLLNVQLTDSLTF